MECGTHAKPVRGDQSESSGRVRGSLACVSARMSPACDAELPVEVWPPQLRPVIYDQHMPP